MEHEKDEQHWNLKKICFHMLTAASLIIGIIISGCVSVPPEVDRAHRKELEIIESLKSSHLAMVDAYVDQKLLTFENFFFNNYGPVYLNHWVESFKTIKNRDYDQSRDFPVLYNDLVAEYQSESEPIESIRSDLKAAIAAEYTNTIEVHNAVGRWLESLEKLNASQRKSIDSLLAAIKPGLSLNSIDEAIKIAKANVEKRIKELQQRSVLQVIVF